MCSLPVDQERLAMHTLPTTIIQLLDSFAPLFSKRVWPPLTLPTTAAPVRSALRASQSPYLAGCCPQEEE